MKTKRKYLSKKGHKRHSNKTYSSYNSMFNISNDNNFGCNKKINCFCPDWVRKITFLPSFLRAWVLFGPLWSTSLQKLEQDLENVDNNLVPLNDFAASDRIISGRALRAIQLNQCYITLFGMFTFSGECIEHCSFEVPKTQTHYLPQR